MPFYWAIPNYAINLQKNSFNKKNRIFGDNNTFNPKLHCANKEHVFSPSFINFYVLLPKM